MAQKGKVISVWILLQLGFLSIVWEWVLRKQPHSIYYNYLFLLQVYQDACVGHSCYPKPSNNSFSQTLHSWYCCCMVYGETFMVYQLSCKLIWFDVLFRVFHSGIPLTWWCFLLTRNFLVCLTVLVFPGSVSIMDTPIMFKTFDSLCRNARKDWCATAFATHECKGKR